MVISIINIFHFSKYIVKYGYFDKNINELSIDKNYVKIFFLISSINVLKARLIIESEKLSIYGSLVESIKS